MKPIRAKASKSAGGEREEDPACRALQQFLAALPDTKICSADEARVMVAKAVVTGFRVSEVLGVSRKASTSRRRPSRAGGGGTGGISASPRAESSRRTTPFCRP